MSNAIESKRPIQFPDTLPEIPNITKPVIIQVNNQGIVNVGLDRRHTNSGSAREATEKQETGSSNQ